MRPILLLLAALVFVAVSVDSARSRPRPQAEDEEYDNPRLGGRAGGSRFPSPDSQAQYIRIKAELIKLYNDKGIVASGSGCDLFGQCDPTCKAYLDTERPNADWPGAVPEKNWKTVFSANDQNTAEIGVTIKKDICGGQNYHEANLRVVCYDADPASNDLMNQFDCPINRFPYRNEDVSLWSHEIYCLPRYQSDKIKLGFRYNIFNIPRSQCNTTLAP